MRFVDIFKIKFGDDAEFEAKHARDKNGQFSHGGSSESNSEPKESDKKLPEFDRQKFEALIGPEFKGVRRQAAVRKLLEEKRGHVKGAFFRKDIGDIDLIWGNDSVGLCHIIKRRKEQGVSVENLAEDLSDVVLNGDLFQSSGKYEIWHRKKMVVATRTFNGSKITFVLTAFPSRKKPARFNKQA